MLYPASLVVDGGAEQAAGVVKWATEVRPPERVHVIPVRLRASFMLHPERFGVGGEALVEPDVRPRFRTDRIPPPLVGQFMGHDEIVVVSAVEENVAVGSVGAVLHGAAERESAVAVFVVDERVLAEQLGKKAEHVDGAVERFLGVGQVFRIDVVIHRHRIPQQIDVGFGPAHVIGGGYAHQVGGERVGRLPHVRHLPAFFGCPCQYSVAGGGPAVLDGVPRFHHRLVIGPVLAGPPGAGALWF